MSKWKVKYGYARRLKKYVRVDTRRRTIRANPEDVDTMPPGIKACMDKLIKQHGFSAQTEIR